MTGETNGVVSISKYETEEGLKKVADHLRRRSGGMPPRQAIELEKRVEYFKGEKLIKFLTNEKNKIKGMPPITSEAEAIQVAKALLKHEYFHRSEKKGKGALEVCREQTFELTGYYTWIYQGSQTLSHLMTALIILGFLVVTCFPIWPQFLKVWMWYASVTLLGFILVFVTLRCLIWLTLWVMGYEFWILPRLFDESLAFCESFVPVWSFEPGSPGQGYYRTAIVIAFGAFCYWAYTQPTDFDSFIAAQKDFVADLYEGNLLSDVSQEAKENIDKPRMHSLEDLLNELHAADSDTGNVAYEHSLGGEIDEELAAEMAAEERMEQMLQAELADDEDDEDEEPAQELEPAAAAQEEEVEHNSDPSPDVAEEL